MCHTSYEEHTATHLKVAEGRPLHLEYGKQEPSYPGDIMKFRSAGAQLAAFSSLLILVVMLAFIGIAMYSA